LQDSIFFQKRIKNVCSVSQRFGLFDGASQSHGGLGAGPQKITDLRGQTPNEAVFLEKATKLIIDINYYIQIIGKIVP
jgi:hypothetical protein